MCCEAMMKGGARLELGLEMQSSSGLVQPHRCLRLMYGPTAAEDKGLVACSAPVVGRLPSGPIFSRDRTVASKGYG